MPNGHGETAADYAWDAARGAQDSANRNHDRIARLEQLLIDKGVITEEERDDLYLA